MKNQVIFAVIHLNFWLWKCQPTFLLCSELLLDRMDCKPAFFEQDLKIAVSIVPELALGDRLHLLLEAHLQVSCICRLDKLTFQGNKCQSKKCNIFVELLSLEPYKVVFLFVE